MIMSSQELKTTFEGILNYHKDTFFRTQVENVCYELLTEARVSDFKFIGGFHREVCALIFIAAFRRFVDGHSGSSTSSDTKFFYEALGLAIASNSYGSVNRPIRGGHPRYEELVSMYRVKLSKDETFKATLEHFVLNFSLLSFSRPLVEGRVQKGSTCPYLNQCRLWLDGVCKHQGVGHDVDFSCATARVFEVGLS